MPDPRKKIIVLEARDRVGEEKELIEQSARIAAQAKVSQKNLRARLLVEKDPEERTLLKEQYFAIQKNIDALTTNAESIAQRALALQDLVTEDIKKMITLKKEKLTNAKLSAEEKEETAQDLTSATIELQNIEEPFLEIRNTLEEIRSYQNPEPEDQSYQEVILAEQKAIEDPNQKADHDLISAHDVRWTRGADETARHILKEASGKDTLDLDAAFGHLEKPLSKQSNADRTPVAVLDISKKGSFEPKSVAHQVDLLTAEAINTANKNSPTSTEGSQSREKSKPLHPKEPDEKTN